MESSLEDCNAGAFSVNALEVDKNNHDISSKFKESFCSQCNKAFLNSRGLAIHNSKCHYDFSQTNLSSSKCKNTSSTYSLISGNESKISISKCNKLLSKLKSSTPMLRRVPRGARATVADSLRDVLQQILRNNIPESWIDLFLFPYVILCVPSKADKVNNLTKWVKQRVQCWSDSRCDAIPSYRKRLRKPRQLPTSIPFNIKNVENKLADGDIHSAVRLLTSEDTIEFPDATVLEALREKHPGHSHSFVPPDLTEPPIAVSSVSVNEFTKALTVNPFPQDPQELWTVSGLQYSRIFYSAKKLNLKTV